MQEKKLFNNIPPKKKNNTLPHLLTLQALYQPPYSPYGVLSLCLPLGVNKGEEEKRSGRMDCDAQNWIINEQF